MGGWRGGGEPPVGERWTPGSTGVHKKGARPFKIHNGEERNCVAMSEEGGSGAAATIFVGARILFASQPCKISLISRIVYISLANSTIRLKQSSVQIFQS